MKNQSPQNFFSKFRALLVLAAGLGVAQGGMAALVTDTWSATPTDGNWTNAANWVGSIAPNTNGNDLLVFSTISAGKAINTNNFPAGSVFGNIYYPSGAATYTNWGNAITLTNGYNGGDGFPTGGSITNASTANEIINLPMTLTAGNHYITTTAAGKLFFTNTVTRNIGGFVQFNLNGSNNVTGSGLTNNNGILGGWAVIGMAANAGNWASLDINSNVIPYASYTGVSSGSTIASNSTENIRITTGATYQLTGSGAGTTVNLNTIQQDVNTTTTVDVGSGTNLILGQEGGIMNLNGSTGSGSPFNSGNKVLTIGPATANGAGTITAGTTSSGGEIALLNNAFLGGQNDLVVYPTIQDNAAGGKVDLIVMGYAVLESSNTYSGGTYVNQGRLNNNGTTGTAGTGPVYVFPGGQLQGSTLTNAIFFYGGVGTTEGNNDGYGAERGETLTGPVTLLGDTSIGAGAISGVISGPGSLIIGSSKTSNGTGTSTIGSTNGPNTYTGDTVINLPTNADYLASAAGGASTLKTTPNNIMPYGAGKGNVIIQSPNGNSWGVFNINGTVQTINGLYCEGADPGNTFAENDSGSGTLVVGADNSSFSYGGVLRNNGGTFAITKIGTGKFTVTPGGNPNGYTGNTVISNGVMSLGNLVVITNTAQIAVMSGATFDVSSNSFTLGTTAGQMLSGFGVVTGNVAVATAGEISPGFGLGVAGTLSFSNNLTLNGNAANGVTNLFDLDATGSGANDLIIVQTNLVLNGTNTIQVNAYNNSLSGTYTLITYGGTVTGVNPDGADGTNLVLAGIAANGTRQTFVITNNTAAQAVQLVVGGSAATLIWAGDGLNNYWDVDVSQNWLNGGSPDYFFNNDNVTFNDSGSESPAVNLDTNLSPGSVTVTTANTYTFGGGGYIGGSGGLTKNGNGTLIIDNSGTNSFSGAINLSAGTLQVGNNDTNGNLPAVSLIDNGTLIFDITNIVSTNSSTISGFGSLIQEGTNSTVALKGNNNSWTGAVQVLQGTLLIAAVNGAGSGTNTTITVTNSATLDLGGIAGTNAVIASGAGVGGNGAVVNNGASIGANYGISFLTLAADTTIGGSGRWDLRDLGSTTGNPIAAALTCSGGQPFNLTKVGSNFIDIVAVTVDPNLANIDVRGGIFGIEGNTTGLGNPASTLTLEADTNATLQLFAPTNKLNKQFVFDDGSYITNASGSSVIIGPATLNGNVNFAINGTSVTYGGAISGSGNLIKTVGSDPLILTNINTYTGNTLVATNRLSLTGIGSIGNSPQIIVSNGTFDVSGLAIPFSGTNDLVLTNGTFIVSNTVVNINSLQTTNSTIQLVITTPGTASIVVTNLVVGGATNYINVTLPPVTSVLSDMPLISYLPGTLTGTPNFGANPSLPAGYTGYITNNAANSSIDLILLSEPQTVWNGGSASDNDWSDAANWSGFALQNASSPLFNGSTRLINTNDINSGSYANITFNTGAGAFNLFGNPITITGNITNNSSNPQAVNLKLNYNAKINLAGGNSSAPLIIGGVLTNTDVTATVDNITLIGTGILTNLFANTGISSNSLAMSSAANWTIADNPSSTPINATNLGLNILAGGTLNFGTVSSAPSLTTSTLGQGSDNNLGDTGAAATMNMTNGTLTLGRRFDSANANLNVYGGTLNIWNQIQWANASGNIATITVNGGTLNSANSSGSTGNGQFFIASRGTGTLTISGGFVECSTLDVSRNASSGTIGVVNLNGGILQVGSVIGTATANAVTTLGGATATFNFNGGVLRAPNSGEIFQGSNAAPIILPINTIVKVGGAIITNASGKDITFFEPLKHDNTGSALDGGLTKQGAGTMTNAATSSYTGNTTISGGTLALGAAGSIFNSTNISITAGATYDVGAIASYAFSTTNTLTASGKGTSSSTAATIKGASGGTVNLGNQAITLTYDSNHPALLVSQGSLVLGNNAFTVNTTNGSQLAVGAYTIIQNQAAGSVTGLGTYSLAGTAVGPTESGTVSISNTTNVLLTIVNHQPQATNVVLSRAFGVFPTPGISLKINITNLVALNTGDSAGDALGLSAVAGGAVAPNSVIATTTNGSSIYIASNYQNNGDYLVFTPTNNIPETFSYTVTNSVYGSLSASASITINVTNMAGQATGNIQTVSPGSVTTSWAGIPGASYSVERSTNIAPAIWVTIWNTNAPGSGLFQFTDTFPDLGYVPPAAYYRLQQN